MDTYQLTTQQALLLAVLAIWDLVWRGFALWRAGGNRQKGWFIALLIINSVGILPIIYLLTEKSKNHEKN